MRLIYLIIIAAVIAGSLFYVLEKDRIMVRQIDQGQIGRMMPNFEIAGLNYKHIAGQKAVVNFFASWCAPCKIEHPVLIGLQEEGVPIYGIAFRDKVVTLKKYLEEAGDPYVRWGHDSRGTTGIAWGVSGIPETFVVDDSGKILWHFRGPIAGRQAKEIQAFFALDSE